VNPKEKLNAPQSQYYKPKSSIIMSKPVDELAKDVVNKFKNLEKELDDKNRLLNNLENKVAGLYNDKQNEEKEKNKNLVRANSLKDDFDKIISKNEELEREKKDLENQLEKMEKLMKDIDNKLGNKMNEIKKLDKDNKDYSEKLKRNYGLADKLDNELKEKESLKDKMNALLDRIQLLSDENQKLKKAYNDLEI